MMRHLDINLTVTVNRLDLLNILVKNRTQHAKIYEEAVEGFAEHARKKVESLLSLCSGKEDIILRLEAPKDYTSAYDTVIGMLEMHEGETIELRASEFRKLAQDRWEWMDDFLLSNSRYSATAMRALSS